MIDIKANMNNKQVIQHLISIKNGHPKAVARSLNRVAKGARAAASSDIRERVNIKKKDLEKDMKIYNASTKRQTSSIVTKSKSKGLALIKFGGRRGTKRKPASFMMTKGKRIHISGSFVRKMKSGHEGIFIRRGKDRLPIDEKYGPSAAKLMRSRKVKRVVDTHIKVRWQKEYENNMKYYMEKG